MEITIATVYNQLQTLSWDVTALREEVHENAASLREEVHENAASLREEIHKNSASLRGEIKDFKIETTKWVVGIVCVIVLITTGSIGVHTAMVSLATRGM